MIIAFSLLGMVISLAMLVIANRRAAADGTSDPLEGRDYFLRALPWAMLLFVGLIAELILPSSTPGIITPGLPVVIFVISFAGWPYMARIIRGQVLSIREKEFVEAARSLGASDARILFRHILPNLVAPIIVYTTLLIPTNILFEAALSFLGIGVQPPTASWGSMISDATGHLRHRLVVHDFPGPRPPADRPVVQPDRRRPAGRPQSEDEPVRSRRRRRQCTRTYRNKEDHA